MTHFLTFSMASAHWNSPAWLPLELPEPPGFHSSWVSSSATPNALFPSTAALKHQYEVKRAAKLFGLYAAFLVLLWALGFMITAPLLLFLISVLFSYESRPDDPMGKRLLRSAIYAIIVGGALYALYVVVLQTQLPTGALWKLFKK